MTNLIERKYISIGSDLRPLDFARISSYFTLDTLTDIALNRPLGYLLSDSDHHEYLPAVQQSTLFNLIISFYPPLIRLFEVPQVRKMVAPSPNDQSGFGKMMGYGYITQLDKGPIDFFH